MYADTESFTLAAAQIEPVYHDKAGTLDKTCRWIEQAGNRDADLVVFPETYFPGYPYWRGSVSIPRWTDLMIDLQKNSLHVDDNAIDILGDTIADANLHVVLGTNEVSDRSGSETLYNALFYFDRSGNLVGRHRKLMPTHEERAIWGRGEPGSLQTYDTDIGTIGGLICYENHMTLSKAALTAKGRKSTPRSGRASGSNMVTQATSHGPRMRPQWTPAISTRQCASTPSRRSHSSPHVRRT